MPKNGVQVSSARGLFCLARGGAVDDRLLDWFLFCCNACRASPLKCLLGRRPFNVPLACLSSHVLVTCMTCGTAGLMCWEVCEVCEVCDESLSMLDYAKDRSLVAVLVTKSGAGWVVKNHTPKRVSPLAVSIMRTLVRPCRCVPARFSCGYEYDEAVRESLLRTSVAEGCEMAMRGAMFLPSHLTIRQTLAITFPTAAPSSSPSLASHQSALALVASVFARGHPGAHARSSKRQLGHR